MYGRSYGRNNRPGYSEGRAIGGPAFFVGCQFITPFLIGCIYAGIILVLVIIDVEPLPAKLDFRAKNMIDGETCKCPAKQPSVTPLASLWMDYVAGKSLGREFPILF